MMSIQHSRMINAAPRGSVIVTEIRPVLSTYILIKLVHVPLIAVTNSKEIQHCPETSEIQSKYLRERYEYYFISDTKNS